MTNQDILEHYLSTGLIRRCVECQFASVPLQDKQFKEDFFQDLCLIILNYPIEKLLAIHLEGHMNAFLTAVAIRNIWSKTSPYYQTYKKFMDRSDEITKEMEETIADEDE